MSENLVSLCEFANAVKDSLQMKYPTAKIAINKVIKNNDECLVGITIREKDSNIAPNVYVNEYYNEYMDKKVTVDEVALSVQQIYNSACKSSDVLGVDIFGIIKHIQIWIVSRYTLDGTDDYLAIWKCKECESIYLFQGMTTKVFRAYQLIHENMIIGDLQEKFIGFTDIDWDIITEESIKGGEIFDKFPVCKPLKVDITEQYLIMYNPDEPTNPYRVYERLEIEKV